MLFGGPCQSPPRTTDEEGPRKAWTRPSPSCPPFANEVASSRRGKKDVAIAFSRPGQRSRCSPGSGGPRESAPRHRPAGSSSRQRGENGLRQGARGPRSHNTIFPSEDLPPNADQIWPLARGAGTAGRRPPTVAGAARCHCSLVWQADANTSAGSAPPFNVTARPSRPAVPERRRPPSPFKKKNAPARRPRP